MQAPKVALFATVALSLMASRAFADEGLIVCQTLSAATSWKGGSKEQRLLLRKQDECFPLPAEWKILVSDESKEFTAMTVSPPGNAAPMSVWSAQRLGDD